jgi:hypothetical protein
VLNYPLDKNNSENVSRYYELLCETIWLIGNSTPIVRGTGTLVEGYLAAMCLHKDLPCPILRLEYPQLDCLNIALGLTAYKKRFLSYFEPESLAACVRVE